LLGEIYAEGRDGAEEAVSVGFLIKIEKSDAFVKDFEEIPLNKRFLS